MTANKIPERLTKIPAWLVEGGKPEAVANDLISLNYWHIIDERARIKALAAAKKWKGWKPRTHPENQVVRLQKLWDKKLIEATNEIMELIGDDTYGVVRSLAEGADKGFDSTIYLPDVLARAQVCIALIIEEKGLLPYLQGEYASTAEYLISKRTAWDGTGTVPGSHSETDFLILYLIPTLAANGFPRELVIGVGDNFHKARYAIPYIRTVLSDIVKKSNEIKTVLEEATDDEERLHLEEALQQAMKMDTRLKDIMEELVDEMVRTTEDGGMTIRDFQQHMKDLAHKNTVKPDKSLGYIYHTPQGGVMMISVADRAHLKALEMACNKLVDWHLGTPKDLAREVGAKLLEDKT